MKKLSLPAILSVVLGLTLVAFAQQPPPGRPPQQPPTSPQQERDREQPSQGEKVTLTGCLAKAGEASQFTITDKDSHEKITFAGPAQLDQYVNQTVKLIGSMEAGKTGEKVFHPESLAPVSRSCA